MKIYVIKGKEHIGPFSKSEIENGIKTGAFTGDEIGWIPNDDIAKPLSHIIAKANIVSNKVYSTTELTTLADRRKFIILVAGLSVPFGFMPGPRTLVLVFTGIWLVLNVLGIVFALHIAGIMGKNRWLWFIATAIPLFNLAAFARIVNESGKVLIADSLRTKASSHPNIGAGKLEMSARSQ